jgi:hypothetical protein
VKRKIIFGILAGKAILAGNAKAGGECFGQGQEKEGKPVLS